MHLSADACDCGVGILHDFVEADDVTRCTFFPLKPFLLLFIGRSHTYHDSSSHDVCIAKQMYDRDKCRAYARESNTQLRSPPNQAKTKNATPYGVANLFNVQTTLPLAQYLVPFFSVLLSLAPNPPALALATPLACFASCPIALVCVPSVARLKLTGLFLIQLRLSLASGESADRRREARDMRRVRWATVLIFSLMPCVGEEDEDEECGCRCLSTPAAVRTISLSRMGLGISGKKGAMK